MIRGRCGNLGFIEIILIGLTATFPITENTYKARHEDERKSLNHVLQVVRVELKETLFFLACR